MDVQLYKTFVTILETGNYSNTAIKLDYAQSTITNQILTLENNYGGIKLLERKGNLMMPTASGEILRKYAVQIIELYDRSRNEIINQKPHIVRIGTINSLADTYLPRIIKEIRIMNPDISIQLFNDSPQFLYSMLKDKELDMMFIVDNKNKFSGFSTKQIKEEQLVIITSANHRLANKESVSFDDIREEHLILTENGCNYRRFLLEEFKKNKCIPKIALELGSIESIKQAIMNNWGIGFLPSFLIKKSDQLVTLKFDSPFASFYSLVVYSQNEICSHGFIKRMISAVRDYVILLENTKQ